MNIPYTLDEKSIRDRLHETNGISTLNELADRGIFLNNWQINKLLLGGDRGYGKSYLAYVKVALQHLKTGFTLSVDDDLSVFDEDATTSDRKRTFINELYVFLAEHYSDVFILSRINSKTLCAVLRKPDPADSKRWWNKG